jgi:hypothetical protein
MTPGRAQLIDILGVLRRPQTAADLPPALSRFIGLPLHPAGRPDLPLVRYTTTTPWREKLYFVPMKPYAAAQIEGVARQQHLPTTAFLHYRRESLSVISSEGGGGAGDAAGIEAGHGWPLRAMAASPGSPWWCRTASPR